MLELDEGKLSRPVLRRGDGSNPGSLAGEKKLSKFWTLKEAKLVDSLSHRYRKALALYQKTQKIAAS